MTEYCEMIERRKAYNLSIKNRTSLFCEIPRGECPYRNEGKRIMFTESGTGEVCVCTTKGLVEKAGLMPIALNDNEPIKPQYPSLI